MNQVVTYTAAAVALGMIPANVQAKKLPERPNVIFILADDHGWGDLSYAGNPYMQTPNLDNFARNSLCFTNFHVGTTSAPTRSALMTGHFGNTTGVWHTVGGRSLLDLDEYTLANAFQDNGYHTGMFGKWHLGDNHPYRPFERGFDESLSMGGGAISNAPDYWDNTNFDDTYYRNGVPEKQTGYCTDIWFREALDFIRRSSDEPFFCYIATNAVHGPWTVAEEYSRPFVGHPDVTNPAFCGMMVHLDEKIGEFLSAIEKLGLFENTIVVYMTDNGTQWGGSCTIDKNKFITKGFNAGMRGAKGSEYEGGHRVPFFMHLPGEKAREIDALTAHIDFMPTLVELCHLDLPDGLTFDGTSLMPLINGKNFPDRILCVDTQRVPRLVKYKQSCVMQGKWRLINSNELYDLNTDPEQRKNIADEYPERVRDMRAAYEQWWERNTVRAKDFQHIVIDPDAESNVISCHDLYVEETNMNPAWHQNIVRKGGRANGEWKIAVEEEGDYSIALYRWAPETGKGLFEIMPRGKKVPNGRAAAEGVVLPITGGRIKLDGKTVAYKQIDDREALLNIPFTIHLKPGKYSVSADFELNGGEYFFSAYYIDMVKSN